MPSGGNSATILPGLGLAVAVAVAAIAVHHLFAVVGLVVPEVVLAVAFGIGLAAIGMPERVDRGTAAASTTVLRSGVVLLGAAVSLGHLAQLGPVVLAVIALGVVIGLGLAITLSRVLRAPRRTGVLLGVGAAICGNSAIAATAPTIGASRREVSQAVAVTTLFGTLALFGYPLIGSYLSMDDALFGAWAGVAIHDTAQVVAAGFAHSQDAGELAVAVKLVRNMLMAPVLVVLALAFPPREAGARLTVGRVRKALPGFVVAFLALAAASSLGWVAWLSDAVGFSVASVALSASQLLIVTGLAGVGLATSPRSFRHGSGRAIVVGLMVAATIGVVSGAILTAAAA